MRPPVVTPLTASSRPAWMDATIALPAGILIATLTGGADGLKAAVLSWLAGGSDPSRLEIFTAHLSAQWLAPALLVWLALRFTRLGAWLAPNWLSVGGLALANVLFMFYAVRGVYLACQGQPPYFGQEANRVLTPVLATVLALGLGALAASTMWHRLLGQSPAMRAVCRRLMAAI